MIRLRVPKKPAVINTAKVSNLSADAEATRTRYVTRGFSGSGNIASYHPRRRDILSSTPNHGSTPLPSAAGPIASDDTVTWVGYVNRTGAGNVTISGKVFGEEVVSITVSPTSSGVWHGRGAVVRRITYSETVVWTITYGGGSVVGCSTFLSYDDCQPVYVAGGGGHVFCDAGYGTLSDGTPAMLKDPVSVPVSGSPASLKAWLEPASTWTVERAVVAGRGVSDTVNICEVRNAKFSIGQTWPIGLHMPLMEFTV